jgi:endo-1,4-beta-xylanase
MRLGLTRRSLLAAPALLSWRTGAAAAEEDVPGLHRQALTKGRFYGAAIDNNVLHTDLVFMAQVPVECGILTGESAFKWNEIQPGPTKFNFTHADALMTYAMHHDMQLRGHTLLWHEANPKWLVDTIDKTNAEQLLVHHINNVCRRYRHRLTHWDVANEVLWPRDNQPGGMRNSIWYQALGPRMLDIAFHACAEAAPESLRFINDFGMDYTWKDNETKRHAMLMLLADLKKRNVPIQGVGLQAHLEAGVGDALNQTVLAKFCDDIQSMGLQVVVTEMDVRDNRSPAAIDARDTEVAAHGGAYLDAVLSCPATKGVVTWGLSDRRTWLNDDEPRKDGLPQRALPLDTEMRRKKLWSTMAACFAAAPDLVQHS